MEVGFRDGELLLNKSKTKRAKAKSKEKEPEAEEVVEGEVVDLRRSPVKIFEGTIRERFEP